MYETFSQQRNLQKNLLQTSGVKLQMAASKQQNNLPSQDKHPQQ
jgi:hypothetical protein